MLPDPRPLSASSRLQRVEPAALASLRLAAARPTSMRLTIGTQQLQVDPVWDSVAPTPQWSVGIPVGSDIAWLEFDRIDPLLPEAEELLAEADALSRRMVIQQLVEVASEAIAAPPTAPSSVSSAVPIRVQAGAAPTPHALQLQWQVQARADAERAVRDSRARGSPARIGLRCAASQLDAVARWWHQRGRPTERLAIPVVVRVRIAGCTLAVDEILALAPGDVVLPDRLQLAAGRWQVQLLAGSDRRPFARGYLDGELVVITQNEAPTDPSPEFRGTGVSAAAEQLTADVAFEIGTRRISLGELLRVGPGYVFDLGTQADGEVVDLVVGGQAIGRGHLVLLGEALGVRVTRVLVGSEASPPATTTS